MKENNFFRVCQIVNRMMIKMFYVFTLLFAVKIVITSSIVTGNMLIYIKVNIELAFSNIAQKPQQQQWNLNMNMICCRCRRCKPC